MLYPSIKPYAQHELAVESPHVLYIEETGNPAGKPVMVLHSGPGAGSDPHFRRFFDPDYYRIILFDQRGSGRSKPHACVDNNHTEGLIEDIDAIRHFLGLEHFILFGTGFGSLLALLYAQQFPQQIQTLLLHQVFLGRKKDIDWFYQQGTNQIYPDYWQDFVQGIPENEAAIPEFFRDCLQGVNEVARMAAAKTWALWQARCHALHPHLEIIDQFSDPHFALALATIESHYVTNRYFIEENLVLKKAKKLRHIPCYIVHGRYDMVSPLANAWTLHHALPASQLRIVRDAGHSNKEPGIIEALIQATKEIATALGKLS